ncbi:putative polygalacturonase [Apostasia shenzhenica]|uniref:Putative polygalacturonase n=1 Tax=Apostasia shenzhenica TaxID=1088818 RepID=A0A2I0AER7_9ASPA|nr:putative polygalacturonase [Apostasia shenzhenica]
MVEIFSAGGRFHFNQHRRWLPTTIPYPLIVFAVMWILVFGSLFVWQRSSSVDGIRLFGLARRLERSVPKLRPVVLKLTEFGAVGDGRTLNTEAFESAVAAISRLGRKGGGQLNVPRGLWLTAPFNLTSHMTLFLEEDAAILAIQASKIILMLIFERMEITNDYNSDENYWPLMPPLPSYGYGREHAGPRYGSLIHGQHLKDVVITGHNGTIDGQGRSWWMKYKKKLLNYTRGPLLQIMWSQDIVISNITLRDSPFWTIHPYDCSNVSLSGLTILAPVTGAPNTDGIDPGILGLLIQCKISSPISSVSPISASPYAILINLLSESLNHVNFTVNCNTLSDSCENMVIENCFICVGDDGIAIKSGWDQYGIAYGRPSTNISIRNVTLRSVVSAGLSIGSEMSGGVSNVTMDGIRVWDSRRGVRIKTAAGRGGYVRRITCRNLTLDNVRVGIVVKTDYNEHPDAGYDPRSLPVIEGLEFAGVRGSGVRVPVRIHGSEEIPVRGVAFREMSVGISYKKKHIFQCSFVEGRVLGSVFPAPCENLDRYDEEGRLVSRSAKQNATDIDYDF